MQTNLGDFLGVGFFFFPFFFFFPCHLLPTTIHDRERESILYSFVLFGLSRVTCVCAEIERLITLLACWFVCLVLAGDFTFLWKLFAWYLFTSRSNLHTTYLLACLPTCLRFLAPRFSCKGTNKQLSTGIPFRHTNTHNHAPLLHHPLSPSPPLSLSPHPRISHTPSPNLSLSSSPPRHPHKHHHHRLNTQFRSSSCSHNNHTFCSMRRGESGSAGVLSEYPGWGSAGCGGGGEDVWVCVEWE